MASLRLVLSIPEEKLHALWEIAARDQKTVQEYIYSWIDTEVAGSSDSRVEILVRKYAPFLVKEQDGRITVHEDFKAGKVLAGRRSNELFKDMRDIGYLYVSGGEFPTFEPQHKD